MLSRQGEVDQLKAEHETFATRNELSEQVGLMQERMGNTENQISEVDQRIINLEQESGGRVGGLSGTVWATLTL